MVIARGWRRRKWELQLNRKNRNLLYNIVPIVNDVCTLRVLRG